MDKNCDNCINSGRPSYEYPCTACETAYGSAPSKWESMVSATADMVEVVRCKDCIYYEETFGKDSGKPCGYGSCGCTCQIITGIIYDEDFCSYGERKNNG